MIPKPQHKDGYDPATTALVKSHCVLVMARLDSLKDHVVIVVGLVPTLLIPPTTESVDDHIGTIDIDLGLTLEMVQEDHYYGLDERLTGAGFEPDDGPRGKTVQRWRHTEDAIIIDFLMPTRDGESPGIQPLIGGRLGAFRTPALSLAFLDRIWIEITGQVTGSGRTTRTIPVCGPGAFVVLKALACEGRSEPKDAYDLYFMVSRYATDINVIPRILVTLSASPYVEQAIVIITRLFQDLDCEGPYKVAGFLGEAANEGLRADVAGALQQLVRLYRQFENSGP